MQGVIFDMDGLLLDTERLYQESWTVVAGEMGLTPDPAFPAAVSGSSGEIMRDLIHRYYPTADPFAMQDACIRRVNFLLDRDGPPVKPGARSLLAYLRQAGMKTALASSTGRARILSNLRQAGLDDFFDAVVSGQEVRLGKPEPDIFLLAAERIGCPPEACFVLEDSVNGVRAGMAAGCVTVMVPDLTAPPEGLAVHRICDSLTAFQALLESGEL